MRDPLEAGRLHLGGMFSSPDPSDQREELAYFQANERIGSLRLTSKLLSFSTDADAGSYRGTAWNFGRGWARARMWEQYADSGRGVCLVFDHGVLEPFVLEQLQELDPRSLAGPVKYRQEGLAGEDAADLRPAPGQSGEELVEQHLEQFMTILFLTKLLDWESEHEYRFVQPSYDDVESFVRYGDALTAVVLGHEFPDWQRSGALEAADRAAISVFKLRWDLSKPELSLITKAQ
jgi:hypothetical protein